MAAVATAITVAVLHTHTHITSHPQVEINPFGETPDGQVVCFDAKLAFDQNAVFRQPEVVQMADEVEAVEVQAAGPQSTVALEADATKHGLNYIGLAKGNIGCIVNGAGLAMATMDLIHHHGGEPANFLDLGGGVSTAQVEHAFKLLTGNPLVCFCLAICVSMFQLRVLHETFCESCRWHWAIVVVCWI